MNGLHPTVTTHAAIQKIAPGTKVLFATVPADGHVNPLTGLAAYLQSIGCDVRWYTSTAYQQKIEKLGVRFYPLVKALDLARKDIEEVFADRVHHKSMVAKLNYDLTNVFIKRGPEYFDDIQQIYEAFPFEVMVADLTFTAIPLVKKVMGIPVITIGIVPLTENSKDLPPSGLGMTPSAGLLGKLKEGILRFAANNILFAKSNKAMKEMLAQYDVKAEGANLFDVLTKESSILLQSGTPSFEYKRSDMGKNIQFIGPLLPHTSKNSATWTNPKIHQYNRVILVTQGTVEKDLEKLIVPTLEAFKGSSDTLVVVTTGGAPTEALKARYPQDNIIIEDFIPFDSIMPYTDVYVTNGGYGGVLLGIQNGLPMVVAGVHEGKSEICARVGYFKLGINLKTEKPKPQQIKKSVEAVLGDKTYRQNVERLAKEFKQYQPGPLCATYIAQILAKKHKVVRAPKAEPAY